MQNSNPAEESAFVHAYNWHNPQKDIQRALQVIHCAPDHEEVYCPATFQDNHEVNSMLASHPLTPPAVLDHLSACVKHPKVLERVAANSSASRDTLRRLARCESHEVRQAVAEGASVDLDTLLELARDPHSDVRFTLAENHNIPVEVLEELEHDENPYVAHRARMTRRRLDSANSQPEQLVQRHRAIRRAAQM